MTVDGRVNDYEGKDDKSEFVVLLISLNFDITTAVRDLQGNTAQRPILLKCCC